MSNSFKQWLRKYWPTFVYIGAMCAIYVFLVLLFTNWFWPIAYRNGEPIVAGLQSTAETRLLEKEAFQARVQFSYFKLGIYALVMYIIFCLHSLLRMNYMAHIRFATTLRKALLGCYFALVVNECDKTFILASYEQYGELGKSILFTFSIVTGLGWLFSLLFKSIIQPKKWGASHLYSPLLYLTLTIFVSLGFLWIDQIWVFAEKPLSFIFNIFAYLFDQTKIVPIPVSTTGYMLRIPVDLMLPAMLMVPFFLLRSAMRNASPLPISGSWRNKAYSMTYSLSGEKEV